jgi:hypothetical protein
VLILCRGTLILGFEQATKYTVYDQDGNAVSTLLAGSTASGGGRAVHQAAGSTAVVG